LETSKVFYSSDQIVIIHDDILTTRAISPDSIDLIVTSPPYNVDIQLSNKLVFNITPRSYGTKGISRGEPHGVPE